MPIKVDVLRTVLVANETAYGRQIKANTVDEVPDELFAGLEAEGYVRARIEKSSPKIVEPTVTEPEVLVEAIAIEPTEDRAEPYRRKRK